MFCGSADPASSGQVPSGLEGLGSANHLQTHSQFTDAGYLLTTQNSCGYGPSAMLEVKYYPVTDRLSNEASYQVVCQSP